MEIAGIYSILNRKDGKRYIGKSSNIQKRFIMHKCLLNNGNHWNNHLQRAWEKCGEQSFLFEIIVESDKDLNRKEKYYIKKYNTKDDNFGYNKTSGGDGLHSPSQETRDKISKTLKKKYASGEKKIIKGKNFFDYWVEKYGYEQALKMKKETYAKVGEKTKKRYKDPKEREKTSKAAKRQWQTMREKMIKSMNKGG